MRVLDRPTPPRLRSVGAKLASATVALVAMVTAGIYLQLSRHQRENLLRAKEASALAVVRLFADSSAAAVQFDDPAELQASLVTLGRNDDIEYGAVWAVAGTGRVTRRLAELRRGRSEEPHAVPATINLRREADRVALTAPIRDVNDRVIGVLAVTFSLSAENAAISRLERSALITSIAVAAGLSILLMVMARLVVVGPLAGLVAAAKRVEEGHGVEIDVRSHDEVGQLAGAFRSMAGAIRVREDRIKLRNERMRLVLDNVGQGFISMNLHGVISEERSRVVDEWFGPFEGSLRFWECLRRFDAPLADYFEVAWAALVEQVLPLDLCLDQLPKIARKDGRTFELTYRPVLRDGALDQTVVVITDVTERVERERAEERQRELMSIYRRLTSDRQAFDGFFFEASALVDTIAGKPGGDSAALRRQVHTLKGDSSLFGLESVSRLCHTVEDRIAETGQLDAADRALLRSAWAQVAAMRAQLVDGAAETDIRVMRADYDSAVADLRRHADHEVVLAALESWELEPASRRLALVAEQIQQMASRMGKAPVDVTCAPTSLRLPPGRWASFWSAFAHVIRNTVDHGVETSERRCAMGRPPRARIQLELVRERDHVRFAIKDDGPGVDWQAIAGRARERGLPWTKHSDLEAALLVDGISSRRVVTTASGRGVGLGAFAAVIRELGGRLEISSESGQGTTVTCWLPATVLAGPQHHAGPPSVRPMLPEADRARTSPRDEASR